MRTAFPSMLLILPVLRAEDAPFGPGRGVRREAWLGAWRPGELRPTLTKTKEPTVRTPTNGLI